MKRHSSRTRLTDPSRKEFAIRDIKKLSLKTLILNFSSMPSDNKSLEFLKQQLTKLDTDIMIGDWTELTSYRPDGPMAGGR